VSALRRQGGRVTRLEALRLARRDAEDPVVRDPLLDARRAIQTAQRLGAEMVNGPRAVEHPPALSGAGLECSWNAPSHAARPLRGHTYGRPATITLPGVRRPAERPQVGVLATVPRPSVAPAPDGA